MSQEHPRCIVYKPVIVAFRHEDESYLGVVYDAGDKATESAMRLSNAVFDTLIAGMPTILAPLTRERLAILKLDETHGG